MEFKFAVNDVFKEPIVEINHNLMPPGFIGDRRALWDVVGKVSEVVNAMGEASAAAQGLTKPITTAERLRNSEHTIYLLIDQSASNGRGAITGMLKTGKKGLYIFDREGQHFQVSPACVLDFYIHESRQRNGLGKRLFEHMLQKEKVEPVKMAIDRPSEKFLGFLDKHYHLNNPIKQMNNYVVFDRFFPSTQEKNGTPVENNNGSSGSALGKKQSANGLQSATHTAPMGRYGAPRPTCSMGQIIHNQSSTIQKTPEPVETRSAPDTHLYQTGNGMTYNPANSAYVVQSAPNVHYSSPDGQQAQNYANYQQEQQQQQQQQQQHQSGMNVAYQPQPQQYQQSNANVAYQQQPQGFAEPQMYQPQGGNMMEQSQPLVDPNHHCCQQSQGVADNSELQTWQQQPQQVVEPLIAAVSPVKNAVESQSEMRHQPKGSYQNDLHQFQPQVNVVQSTLNNSPDMLNQPNVAVAQSVQYMPQTQSAAGFHNQPNASHIGQSIHDFNGDVPNMQAYAPQIPQDQRLMQQPVYNQQSNTPSVVGMQQHQYLPPNVVTSQQYQLAESHNNYVNSEIKQTPQGLPPGTQSNYVYGDSAKVTAKGDTNGGGVSEEEYLLRYGYPPQNPQRIAETHQLMEKVKTSPKLARPRSLSIQLSEEQTEEILANNNDDLKNKVPDEEIVITSKIDYGIGDEIDKLAISESEGKSPGKKTPSHLTEQGFFDLKFYHNKLW